VSITHVASSEDLADKPQVTLCGPWSDDASSRADAQTVAGRSKPTQSHSTANLANRKENRESTCDILTDYPRARCV
jgi:hypothetical protein